MTRNKIIESCQNMSDLKKWARQELPDEIMLLILKWLRKLKIAPDEFDDDTSGEEDTMDAGITPEGGAAIADKRGEKKGANGKKKSWTPDPEPEDDDDETPDFDRSGGKE